MIKVPSELFNSKDSEFAFTSFVNLDGESDVVVIGESVSSTEAEDAIYVAETLGETKVVEFLRKVGAE